MGLGLALARPERRVLVVTGDGELLMNVGTLATAAVMNPPNLAIVCVDNGPLRRDRLAEEPYQPGGGPGADGARSRHPLHPADHAPGRDPGSVAPHSRRQRHVVRPDAGQAERVPPHKRDLDPATERLRFRAALAD